MLALISSMSLAACHPLGQRDSGSSSRGPPRPSPVMNLGLGTLGWEPVQPGSLPSWGMKGLS